MTKTKNIISALFNSLLSEHTREKVENVILYIALASFFIHLAAIYLLKFDIINLPFDSELLKSPISAVYTPFSFILIYEVYLLIYYLPKSFTTYITKQYEIITLIIIRKLFKDLSALELTENWFEIKGDLQFTYDIVASLLLFYLIYLFQKQGQQKAVQEADNKPFIETFVKKKKLIAVILVPLFFFMALYTLIDWYIGISLSANELEPFESINNLFFDEFFTILILVDVVLLLISFFYTNQFHKIIRNSGFVISTILIRMSFSVSGLISTILIVVAVLFGLAIIAIHNKYEKNALPSKEMT
ncbi:hypothetical protein ESY86_10255 [Subsaximicrobium wynnwilliamsii]|uniref:Uncharacterized protein n=1 Tax=Subsaximicrobium wynnwilliamsii TaxID=291179 RepID=A0A5C6ZGT6_9FLAO|nr:hypothetical protein [Subsaximicrobium wynnwilliamsii]TXD83323.1 hypothetical protein ESY87_10165 [Subsaximicrobium wynnwilliamsii]TXD89140.1 hypothetical protein ESY86_10255 [Subsaximicrobium wynnwilliamsii]TXE03347.1 hypothetical protein ESY88_08465 [Subsaximicrobium wynnwilliamsii]